jgi:ABC-type transport system substrate-binding protein
MGRMWLGKVCLVLIVAISCVCSAARARFPQASEERMIADGSPGHAGGRLVVALRSEPKTLNPALALDEPSRDVIRCMTADLIHINRGSLKTEPSLAKSWSVSRDGRQYTLQLRRGVAHPSMRTM